MFLGLRTAVATIELHIRTQTVFTARDGERIVGSARGIVTMSGDKIVLAQMAKVNSQAGGHP